MMLIDYLKNAGAVLLDDIGGMPSYELVREPVDGNGERLEVYVTFTPKMDGCWVSYVYGYVKFKHRFYNTAGKRTWDAIKNTAHWKGFEL